LLAPFVSFTHADLRTILTRLVRAFFCIYDRESGTFSLHSIDRAYCYGQIPVTGQSFTVEVLHRRAAEYYEQIGQPSAQWDAPGDSDSTQQQLHHLLQAGDDTAAARLLQVLSPSMLMWGQLGELRRVHEEMLSRVVDDELRRQHLLMLATVYRLMGHTRQALDYGQQALDSSRNAADAVTEGGALAQLGWAYYDLAQFEPAMTHWNAALSLFQQRGDSRGEGGVLGGLGWVSYLRGENDAAVDYFSQAWNILIRLGDLYHAGVNLGDLGAVRTAQGNIDEAIKILNEALTIADRFWSPREKSYKRGYLATALLFKDDLAAAHTVIAQADQFDVPGNQFFIAALEGIILARLGRTEEAVAAFERAVRRADALLTYNDNAYPAYYGRGLARAGLTLLADGSPARALHDYERARRLCSERGILSHQRRLLDALMRCDHGERLSPLVAALAV
jgi:tetratricopeptide (TPR) repeat protein